MSDDVLSQQLADYSQAERDVINGIIEEEQQKTRKMLATPKPAPSGVLIGAAGMPDGMFGAADPD